MIMKQKRKKIKEAENERYVIDVEDWEASYAFNQNEVSMKLSSSGGNDESLTITLLGKIRSPTLQNVLKTKIEITGCPILDDRQKQERTDDSRERIGLMVVLKDSTLSMHCSITSRLVQCILMAAIAEKITHALVWGTKLSQGKGEILGIDLATRPEEL